MLKITRSEESERGDVLKLEGKLLGPWIDVLASACGEVDLDPNRVKLDLGGLTYVDAEGVEFLRSLIREGTQVIACSEFVVKMLLRTGS